MKNVDLPKLSKQGNQILVSGDVDIEKKQISDGEGLQVSLVSFDGADVVENTIDVKIIDNVSMKHIDIILFKAGSLQEAMNLLSVGDVSRGMMLLLENRENVETICHNFTNLTATECKELDTTSLIQVLAKILSTPAVSKLLEYYAKKNGTSGDVKKKI